jgi:aubergine-like protein
MRNMGFERVGRSFYNPKRSTLIQNLDVWPGFAMAVQRLEIGPALLIDPNCKVIRQDKLIGVIQQMIDQGKSHEVINEELKFKSVVTSYGNDKHTYEIESIDFNQSPHNTFEQGKAPNAKTISFHEYYKEKYGIAVKDLNQPLVITKDRRTGR